MRQTIPRWAGWGIKLFLTAAVTYFLFRSISVSWSEIAKQELTAWRPRIGRLAASVTLLLIVFAYLVALWSRMIRVLGGPALSLPIALKVFFIANLGRYLPGKVWQLVGLAYLARREGVSAHVASAAAILGQTFSLGAAVIVAAIGLALGGARNVPADLMPWAVGLAILVALAITIPGALRAALRFAFRFGSGGPAPPEVGPWFGSRWLAMYLPAWLSYGIAFSLLWSSFPPLPAVSWTAAIGAFAGAYFLGYAAIFAPAGIGVREGAIAVLLAPWMGPAQSTVLALFARLWMTLAELVPVASIGGLALIRRLSGKSEPEIMSD